MGGLSAWVIVVVALAVAGVVLAGFWMSWTAGRLDRMHLRLEAARSSLEVYLARRASVAGELAAGGLIDPASALLLLEAARAARESVASFGGLADGDPGLLRGNSSLPLWRAGVEDERWIVESELTATLYALDLPPTTDEPLIAELTDAARKAGMARRIHNDLVATTGRLHKRRRVRWFHLAGHAAPPRMIDFDDRSDFAATAAAAPGSDV